MLISSRIPSPSTTPDDLRVGHFIQKEVEENVRVVLIGFGSDEGVRRNGGRVGAADAPDSIRKALFKLTPDAMDAKSFIETLEQTLDAGNVHVTGNVEEDQEALGKVVAKWLSEGAIPIILGGGHETSYGHFEGYVREEDPVEIFNIDAHPDVRPLKDGQAHSGSPFYQAITHPNGLCRRYTVAGLLSWSVADAHRNFLEAHGARYVWRKDVTTETMSSLFTSGEERIMFSMDMDAVNQAEAPGVSAPAVDGLPANTWLQIAYLAGRCKRVSSFDLVEVNPRLDVDERTVRLAALTIWHFLRGISQREREAKRKSLRRSTRV